MSTTSDNLALGLVNSLIIKGMYPEVTAAQKLWSERTLAVEALHKIVNLDYRGNQPHEQLIALKALESLGEVS